MKVLVESQYSGCMAWWAAVSKAEEVYIDLGGHYQKGSYRNRCHILSPNDMLRLSVPLEKGKHQRRAMGNVVISYEQDWQKIHWMSLTSSYRRSAYFEYYEQDIAHLFETKYTALHELNSAICTVVADLLGIQTNFINTESYIVPGTFHGYDLRDRFLPGDNTYIHFPAYPQVFSDRHPFHPNLSIWDALFNIGPATNDYLEKIDLNLSLI
jgi:hypothetical protein